MAFKNIRLIYFDLTGRAEIIRLVLVYKGTDFDDVRIARDKWPEIKPTSPFGQVPFIEIDGKVYGQSLAIANYFAREYGLYGSSNLDGLKIDQLSQLTEDFIQCVAKSFREPDETKKAEIVKKVKEEDAPRYLGFVEKLIAENKGEYFVGNSLSLADIIVYDIKTGFLGDYVKDSINNYPNINRIADKVASNERIKAYAAKQK